jgi:hypothetical protein
MLTLISHPFFVTVLLLTLRCNFVLYQHHLLANKCHRSNSSVISWRGSRLYWLRKPEYPEKTTDLSQVTDKLCNRMLYRAHLALTGGKRCSLTFNLFLKLANNYSCFIFLYWCTTFRGVSTTTIVFRRITIYTHYNT